MSAFLAKECKDSSLALEGHERFALVSIRVGILRQRGLTIIPAPKPELPPGHVHVSGRKTDAVPKALAKNFRWIVEPPADVKLEAREKASR
jgi:hypothetical protein